MSDDRPKRDSASFSSIPPELRPFMGQQGAWPEAERRNEADVEAAFASVEAKLAEWQREADERDAARGVGNASEYVAPVIVPGAEKPIAPSTEAKVAIAIADVPRKLPAGNPNHPTQEISTRAFRAKVEGKRTLGGNTQKMPIVAIAHEDDAPGSVTPATSHGDGRGRVTGLVIAAALALAAAGLGVRTVTKTTPPTAPSSALAASVSAAPSLPTAAAVSSALSAPIEPSASALPTTSAHAPTVATAHSIAPAPKQHPSDDPYDAAPPPASTPAPPMPAPPPTAIQAPAPSQKPVAPPTPSASPVGGSPVY